MFWNHWIVKGPGNRNRLPSTGDGFGDAMFQLIPFVNNTLLPVLSTICSFVARIARSALVISTGTVGALVGAP